MRNRNATYLVALAAVAALSCTGPRQSSSSSTVQERALRVGTNGDTPPYAFRRGERLEGLEIDLSTELGKALGRPVDLVDLPWDRLFDALLAGKVDVLMDGLTVTPEREVRVAFGAPYLRTTIAVLIRREDTKRFRSPDEVCDSPIDVGVVAETTGEKHLRERCPVMLPRVYRTVRDAVGELRGRRIDAVAHDGPVLLWLQSRYEAELQVVPTRITDERLAWAFRREDVRLRERADAALATMRANGTLDRILGRWVPGAERLRAN
jgi:polar amino acid transport system substrate-binding protein